MNVNLKGLFTPEAIASHLTQLPPLKTSIMDKAFKNSANHMLPTIGIADLKEWTGTVPLVKRSGNPIPIASDESSVAFYAPLPLMPSLDITAAELNDLAVILGNKATRDQWIARKTDQLRRIARETTEAISSVVLTTGKYSWPVQLDGGKTEAFEIDYGATLSVTVSTMWNAVGVRLMDVFDTLSEMDDLIQENGAGGNVEYFAGKTAFALIVTIAEAWAAAAPQNSPISVKIEEGSVTVGGYKVTRMTERYKSPLTGEYVRKVADDAVVGFSDDQNAGVKYCAIDSISANNAATPFHIYVKEIDDRAIRLIAQSKPVPARNPRSICVAKVTA